MFQFFFFHFVDSCVTKYGKADSDQHLTDVLYLSRKKINYKYICIAIIIKNICIYNILQKIDQCTYVFHLRHLEEEKKEYEEKYSVKWVGYNNPKDYMGTRQMF